MKYSIGDLFFLSIKCTHKPLHVGPLGMCVYVVVQFYPLVKLFFPLFWAMVMHDNQLKTKANKNYSKDKTNHFRYIRIHALRLRGIKQKKCIIHCWASRWFLLFYPQALQPSMNFNVWELVYWTTTYAKKIQVLGAFCRVRHFIPVGTQLLKTSSFIGSP